MDDTIDLDVVLARLGEMDPYARAQFNVAALQVRMESMQARLAQYEQSSTTAAQAGM